MNAFFVNAGFSICSIIMMLLLLIIFTVKTKNWNIKSISFFLTGLITILILFYEILLSYSIVNYPGENTFNIINSRIYMFLNMLWLFTASGYIMSLLLHINNNKKIKIIIIIYILISIISCLSFSLLMNISINACIKGEYCFIGGNYYIIITFLSIGLSVIHAIALFASRNKIPNLNISPIIFLSILFVIFNMLIFHLGIRLNILSMFFSLTITILFLTLENQDIKILDNYNKIKEESVEIGKAKTDFLVNMSHKIRTPLTTIMGFSQSALYSNNLDENRLLDDLKNVKIANDTLSNLISCLSDLSKLETNKVAISESDYNLDSIIYELYSYIPPKINKDNLNFSIEINPYIPKKYYGDVSIIYKSIVYILLNAIEHTSYGEVKLNINSKKVSDNTYELEFTIINSGHTMKEEDFILDIDDYIKLNNKTDNINLGLIIAKRLINMSGGTIEFINKKGMGTRYIVKYIQKNYNEEESIGNILKDDTDHEKILSNLLNLSDKKALVVDDKVDNLSIMEDNLKNYNMYVKVVKSGKDAITAIQKERFDIVFLDKLMPGMNGIDVIKEIKNLIKKLPVMILVANKNKDNEDFKTYGFDDLLTKPIVFKDLNKIINKYFNK